MYSLISVLRSWAPEAAFSASGFWADRTPDIKMKTATIFLLKNEYRISLQLRVQKICAKIRPSFKRKKLLSYYFHSLGFWKKQGLQSTVLSSLARKKVSKKRPKR